MVTVVDTTAPAISVPTVATAEATSAVGAVVTYTAPSATDAVDGTDPVICDAASGDTFALGVTTVHCNSTDAAHNSSTQDFMVTVVDTTAPAISVPTVPT